MIPQTAWLGQKEKNPTLCPYLSIFPALTSLMLLYLFCDKSTIYSKPAMSQAQCWALKKKIATKKKHSLCSDKFTWFPSFMNSWHWVLLSPWHLFPTLHKGFFKHYPRKPPTLPHEVPTDDLFLNTSQRKWKPSEKKLTLTSCQTSKGTCIHTAPSSLPIKDVSFHLFKTNTSTCALDPTPQDLYSILSPSPLHLQPFTLHWVINAQQLSSCRPSCSVNPLPQISL